MKASWKVLSSRNLLIVGLGLALATPSISIFKATQYRRAEPREKTTTAFNVRINFRSHNSIPSPNSYIYSCIYNFAVDGASYSGYVACPQLIDDSIKSQSQGYRGSISIPDRVVYYDSADPSRNDLMEFTAVSASYYYDAAVFIGLGAVIVLLVVVASPAKNTANRRTGKHGIFVDTHGTVIYPDQINPNLGFDGLFNKDKDPQKPQTASQGAPAYVPDSDPSHALRELYLEVVKQIHPDRALNEQDEALRERLMKEANAAFKRGDTNDLRRILQEYSTIAAVR